MKRRKSQQDTPVVPPSQQQTNKQPRQDREVNLDFAVSRAIPGLSIHLGNANFLRIGEYNRTSYINFEKRDDANKRKSGITLSLASIEILRNAIKTAKEHIEKFQTPQ